MISADDEIDLKEYVRVLKRNKWVMLLVIFLGTLSSVLVSLSLPKKYSASAVLMPSGGSRSGGLGAAAAIGAQLGLGGGGSTSTNQLIALLNSRTLTEKVIFKYELLPFLFSKDWDEVNQSWKSGDPSKSPKKMEDAVLACKGIITITDDKKNQTISIQAITESPEMSAKIVNAYVVELANFIKENAFTTSKQNRIFIEEQLARNRAELLKAGTELSGFYRENRALTSEPTVDVDVTKDLLTLQPTASGNPSTQIAEVEGKLDNLNKKLKEIGVVQKVPQQVYLQYLTLRRDLLGQVNTLLTQQYEMAKIEETKEDLNFQVIDWARTPTQRTSPQRTRIVILSFVMSGFFAVLVVFIKESKIIDIFRG